MVTTAKNNNKMLLSLDAKRNKQLEFLVFFYKTNKSEVLRDLIEKEYKKTFKEKNTEHEMPSGLPLGLPETITTKDIYEKYGQNNARY